MKQLRVRAEHDQVLLILDRPTKVLRLPWQAARDLATAIEGKAQEAQQASGKVTGAGMGPVGIKQLLRPLGINGAVL